MIRDRSFREKIRDRDRITDHEARDRDRDRIILKLVIVPITGCGVVWCGVGDGGVVVVW